jgi:hypothetical protein
LHGYSIGAEQWTHAIHVPQTIEGAFAQGAKQMIVVLPDSSLRTYRAIAIDVGDQDGLPVDASKLHDALRQVRNREQLRTVSRHSRQQSSGSHPESRDPFFQPEPLFSNKLQITAVCRGRIQIDWWNLANTKEEPTWRRGGSCYTPRFP